MADNLNRESWLQTPKGKEKEAKGQVWSVRVVGREGRTPRRTRMGTEDTSREGQNKESWGESSEAKLIFLGKEEGAP